MREVVEAKSAGFCFGVRRAVELAEKALSDGKQCWSLGQLIHNNAVIADLERQGLRVAQDISRLPNGVAVITRAHGSGKETYERLCEKGAEIIDATCPKVARIHEIVSNASARGRRVIIIGDSDHPEVRAIRAWCGDALVFSDSDELAGWLRDEPEGANAALSMVFQTTQTRKNLEQSVNLVKKLCTNYETFDTICKATAVRQEEALDLAGKCDAMVVIGDKHSANSTHLAQICAERCGNVQFIEDVSQLDTGVLPDTSIVGITAGASVPAWIIKEVKRKMTDEIKIGETTDEIKVEETAQEVNAEEMTVEVMSEEVTDEVKAEEMTEEVKTEETIAEQAAEPVETVLEQAQDEAIEVEKTFDELLEDSIKTIYSGDVVTGIVAAITPTEISVDIGTKHSGYIPISEFTDDVNADIHSIINIGDEVKATVVRVNDVEGTVMLSKKRLDAIKSWNDIEAAREEGTIVEGVVTEENKGGVVVSVKGIRVFIPASQTGLGRDVPMTELLKTTVRLKITEVNRSRRRVVGSIRAVVHKERKERSEAIWSDIEVGKVYQGVVKSLTSYGAFVDIGGVDGMVHVSELSWKRIRHPGDVVAVGDQLEVFVISFDREARKISLGYKKQEDNPWLIFTSKYQVGDIAPVKIVKLMQFGAFAEIMPSVDGLIHISQIANRRIGKPDEVLTVGETLDVKITNIDNENQKISLSIRALSEPIPAPAKEEDSDRAAPAKREDALVYEVSTTGAAIGIAPEGDAE